MCIQIQLGGRNRDQRWKSDDKPQESHNDKSDKREDGRDRDRKQNDLQDARDTESEQLNELERGSECIKRRAGSISSSQHSTNETDGEQITGADADGNASTNAHKLETETSLDAEIGKPNYN